MKKDIILVITIFISFANCQQVHSNKDNDSFTRKKETIDTLCNNKTEKVLKTDIEIWLNPAVKVRKDTLFFSYKLINNTSKNLLFYHIQAFSIKLESYTTDSDYPKCNILIYDSNHKLPETYTVDTGPREVNKNYAPYAYVLLRAGESRTFNQKEYIGNYHLLGKSFEFKLKYLSPYNKVFINQFKKMQARNPKLKEYERFEGIIESNQTSFTLR